MLIVSRRIVYQTDDISGAADAIPSFIRSLVAHRISHFQGPESVADEIGVVTDVPHAVSALEHIA